MRDARLHGGWLEAWGEPGKGACFRLTLPLDRAAGFTESPLPLEPPDDPAPEPEVDPDVATDEGDRPETPSATPAATFIINSGERS